MCIFPVRLGSPQLSLLHLALFSDIRVHNRRTFISIFLNMIGMILLHIANVDKSLLRRMQLSTVCRNIAQNCVYYNVILPNPNANAIKQSFSCCCA